MKTPEEVLKQCRTEALSVLNDMTDEQIIIAAMYEYAKIKYPDKIVILSGYSILYYRLIILLRSFYN